MDRRSFLTTASVLTAAAATSGWAAPRARNPLKILILGGTRFIGLHMTQLALDRGHTVTFFNRGRTNNDVFPQVQRLKGDRDAQLEALEGRKWDAVIDNSGYVPRHVRLSAELLAPNVQHYVFVSSISVYPDFKVPRSEDSTVAKLDDETIEKVDNDTYGALKALCEQAAEEAMPGRVTSLRPGFIVGPDDNTDRFTYWPARAARGGDMLAPGTPRDPVQVIDVRDLAAFTLNVIENRIMGTFNLVSPPGMFTIGDLVSESVAAAKTLVKPNPPPRPVWVPASFLRTHDVRAAVDMPIWFSPEGEQPAFAQTSAERAIKAGLRIRPLKKTVHDTLAWHLARPEAERTRLKAGISPEREQAVLAAWRAANA
ncbi:MAG TPA: NAD-dependent epimerase/dehydratase family protein [Steroidobacteraceae bacterium]